MRPLDPTQILLCRHLWGVEEDLRTFLPKILSQNIFQGIEAGLIWLSDDQKDYLQSFLEESGFSFIGMIFTDLPFRQSFTVKDHLDEFFKQIERALPLNPVLINVHGGKDSFSVKEQEEYFSVVLDYASTLSIPLVHETHRGRILYNPWTTRDLLEKFPELLLCLDLSHWVTVAERLLDQKEDSSWLSLCVHRCRHIHARVGHEEAPQVSDPRAPEWQRHLDFFEQVWALVLNQQQERMLKERRPFSVTPEYGPFPYLPHLPFQQTPVASLEEVVNWAGLRLKGKFNP